MAQRWLEGLETDEERDERYRAETNKTAVHESGHAIARDKLGLSPAHTVLALPGKGHTTAETLNPGDPGWTPRMWHRETMASLAGYAALWLVGSTDPFWGAEKDFAQARESAARGIALEDGAMRRDDPRDRVQLDLEQVARVLEPYTAAMLTFAQALVGNGGRLGGDEVSQALELAYAGRVWSREVEPLLAVDQRDRFEAAWDAQWMTTGRALSEPELWRQARSQAIAALPEFKPTSRLKPRDRAALIDSI